MLQRKASGDFEATEVPPIVHEVLRSPGQPLDAATREFMEPRFGHDFSQVRVHTDAKASESARAVNALAYTVGRDVVFGDGYYGATMAAKGLLAHELTHVIQQEGQASALQPTLAVLPPGDASEQEAERVSARVERELRHSSRTFELLEPLPFESMSLGMPKAVKQHRSPVIHRKLALHSDAEAKAFKWFLTRGDAAQFEYSKKTKPYQVTMKTPTTGGFEDPFRIRILKTIIDHSETLRIRSFDLDKKVTPHELFKNGKLDKKGVSPTLRELSWPLGAGGVTIPSESLALAVDASYSGPVTGVTNESWIFYSTPTSLAHEFGHAFLLFSGASWKHGQKVPKKAGVITPEGKEEKGVPFEGEVDVFISKFVAEKFAELVLFDPQALHFSPTVIRQWPEPPDFKPTFMGTWLQFEAKYPGATVKQEKRKGKRVLKICVPKSGEICPP